MQKLFLVPLFLISTLAVSHAQDNSESRSADFRQAYGFIQDSADSGANRLLILNDTSLSGDFTYRIHSSMGYSPSQSLVDYLASQHVQKQIEFSAEQKKQLGQIRKNLANGIKELSEKYAHRKDNNIAPELRTQFTTKYNEAIKKYRGEIEEQVKETLVPQQLKLIKQLKFSQSVQMFGLAFTLTQAPFATQLKTSQDQAKEIQKIKQEAEAEIQKSIAEIRKAAKAKMMKELDRKQREKIKELEGDSKNQKTTKL